MGPWMIPLMLVVGGVVSLLVSGYAERYHSNKFKEHTDRLEQLQEQGREDEIGQEVRRFSTESKIDWAISAMFWLQMIGIGLVFAGVFVWLA